MNPSSPPPAEDDGANLSLSPVINAQEGEKEGKVRKNVNEGGR